MKPIACLFLLLAIGSTSSRAQEPEAVKETEPLEVHEWVILLCNPQHGANGREIFSSHLPGFITSRRVRAGADKAGSPTPHGMIAYYGGGLDMAETILGIENGRFLAHWPPAKTRTGRLKWLDLKLQSEAPSPLRPIEDKHWLRPMRDTKALYASESGQTERFVFYDPELEYDIPIELNGDGDAPISIAAKGEMPLLHLECYRPRGDAWESCHLGTLTPPGTNTEQQVEATKLDPWTGAESDRNKVLASWRDHLTKKGYFEHEIEMMLSVMRRFALHEERMTVSFELSREEIERLLPLEIYPLPIKTLRTAIVLVYDVDPGIGAEIEALIKQLGDPSWDKREAAFKRLRELGKRTEGMLKKASEHKDLEIAHRAERLTHLLKAPGNNKSEPQVEFD